MSVDAEPPAKQQQYVQRRPEQQVYYAQPYVQPSAPQMHQVNYPPVKQYAADDPQPVQQQQYLWQQPATQTVYQQPYQQQQGYTYAVMAPQQQQYYGQPTVYPAQQQQSGIGPGGAFIGGLVLGSVLESVMDD